MAFRGVLPLLLPPVGQHIGQGERVRQLLDCATGRMPRAVDGLTVVVDDQL